MVVLLAGCGDPAPKLDARWHFVGADGLRAQRSAPALHTFFSHSNAPVVAARLSTNSTVAATTWLAAGKPVADAMVLAQPLIEDLLAHESAGEVWRHGDGTVEVALAVRVTTERAPVWTENFPKWMKPLGDGSSGAWVSADKGWLIAVSRNNSERASAFRKKIAALVASPARLLEIETAPGAWPGINAVAIASNGAVRWSGTFRQPGLPELPLSDWKYPTNVVRDPLIALTAARGVTPGITKALGIGSYLEGQQIGQLFHWAQTDSPFQSYATIFLSQPNEVVAKVHKELAPLYSTNGAAGTRSGLMMYDAAKGILALASAPGALPSLTSGSTNGAGFLGVSLFPMKRSTNPPPRELLGELLKPGVVFYEWEFTGDNITHWSANLQVRDIAMGLRPPSGDGPFLTWLSQCGASLENTVTEVRQTGAGEFAFTRKAPAALSAFELVLLTRWLDPPLERPKNARSQSAPPSFPVMPAPKSK
jgi:hypothetical protein